MAENAVKQTILIIEDNKDLIDMYTLKLTLEGFTVAVAEDGEKGILKAVEVKPDLILLDILMPNMNGFEVLKALRDNTKLQTKIVVLSNLSQADNMKKAQELGAVEYIVKANSTPSMIVTRVREILGKVNK